MVTAKWAAHISLRSRWCLPYRKHYYLVPELLALQMRSCGSRIILFLAKQHQQCLGPNVLISFFTYYMYYIERQSCNGESKFFLNQSKSCDKINIVKYTGPHKWLGMYKLSYDHCHTANIAAIFRLLCSLLCMLLCALLYALLSALSILLLRLLLHFPVTSVWQRNNAVKYILIFLRLHRCDSFWSVFYNELLNRNTKPASLKFWRFQCILSIYIVTEYIHIYSVFVRKWLF